MEQYVLIKLLENQKDDFAEKIAAFRNAAADEKVELAASLQAYLDGVVSLDYEAEEIAEGNEEIASLREDLSVLFCQATEVLSCLKRF
jgi:hypothetical protein